MQTLRLFHDVARCRSFSRAAAMHGVTQSAASQRVSALEKRLGVTLLNRSVRPLTLTEAGKVFLAGCEDLLERHERLERKVAAMRPGRAGAEPVEGLVHVAAIYSAGIDLLNHIRERFEDDNPRASVRIHYEHPGRVYDMVVSGEADLGIVSYPRTWRKVGTIPLRDEEMVVACRPDHPLASRRRVKASELTGHEMTAFETDLPVGRHVRRYLREEGGSPRVASVFDNIDTIKSAVALTEQFAILPRRTVVREVQAGALAAVDLEPRLDRPLGVIFQGRPRRGQGGSDWSDLPSPAARAFVECLLSHAGPDADPADRHDRKSSASAMAGGRA